VKVHHILDQRPLSSKGPCCFVIHRFRLPQHTYLLHSLHSLCCLRNVDISFCHLSQVPHAIECLHWLERLNLRGNNFVILPSLKKLSKLVSLNLEHCKLLESLPQLPSPTTIGRDHRENNDCWRIGHFQLSKIE